VRALTPATLPPLPPSALRKADSGFHELLGHVAALHLKAVNAVTVAGMISWLAALLELLFR
jgi:hypothetical protein